MRAAIAILFCCLAPIAAAHKPSDSYLTLNVAGDTILGQWDVALRDLEFAIGLDGNGDGAITWGELNARRGDLSEYLLRHLALRRGDRQCSLQPGALLVDRHSDGAYAVVRFAAACASAGTPLSIEYSLFFELDPQHKGLLRLEAAGATHTAIFGASRRSQVFALAAPSPVRVLLDYGREGIWHIWIGYDHILFLISLLLPAVLYREQGRWQPVGSFRGAFIDVVKIVTAFTLAHSFTLSLAVLGIVALPAGPVEAVIAASVFVAAVNNLYLLWRRRWQMAFVFGLVHGLGFANVLGELGLPGEALALALVGFNLGVELGQLAIVAAFLPVAYWLRRSFFYQRMIVAFGSVLIAIIALAWLVERVFNLRLLPA